MPWRITTTDIGFGEASLPCDHAGCKFPATAHVIARGDEDGPRYQSLCTSHTIVARDAAARGHEPVPRRHYQAEAAAQPKRSICATCRATVAWVQTPSQRTVIVDLDGAVHRCAPVSRTRHAHR